MPHGIDYPKEKAWLCSRSYTLYHRRNNAACCAVEGVGRLAKRIYPKFLGGGICRHRFGDWIKTHTLHPFGRRVTCRWFRNISSQKRKGSCNRGGNRVA